MYELNKSDLYFIHVNLGKLYYFMQDLKYVLLNKTGRINYDDIKIIQLLKCKHQHDNQIK